MSPKHFCQTACLILATFVSLSFCLSNPHILITSPNAGHQFHVGDTILFQFSADSTVQYCYLSISFNDSTIEYPINDFGPIGPSDLNWGRFVWIIPETLLTWETDRGLKEIKLSPISNIVRISITDAFNSSFDIVTYYSAPFTILPAVHTEMNSHTITNFISLLPNPTKNSFFINKPFKSAKFITMSGQTIKSISNSNAPSHIDCHSLPIGIYILQITSPDNVLTSKKLIIQR